MSYQEILNQIAPGENIRIRTLGGHSTFTLSRAGNKLVITNANGNSKVLDSTYWDEVENRRDSLGSPLRDQTGQYTHPRWADAPDLIFPPYVAAAIRHFGD